MSRKLSDDDNSVVETRTDRFINATAETEVELRLPLEVDMEPDRILEDITIYLGAVGLDTFGPDLGAHHRLKLLNEAKPKWARHGFQLPRTPGPCGQLLGAGSQLVGFEDGRCTFRITSPTYPGPTQRRPGAGIHPVKPAPDRFAFGIPTPVYTSSDEQLPGLGAQPGSTGLRIACPT